LLEATQNQEEIVHFLFFLRHVEGPWTLDQRAVFFSSLRTVEAGQGAQHYHHVVRDLRDSTLLALSPVERITLAPWIEGKSGSGSAGTTDKPTPRFVREWSFAELESMLARASSGRSFASGKSAFAAAQCVVCHRVGSGADAGGLSGPDLTAVASRFNRRDLLDAIVHPSKVIDDKFRSTLFEVTNGSPVAGNIESENAERVIVRPNLLVPETVTLAVKDIRSRKPFDISSMPVGLLNLLGGEQILDLIAFLESGGNPEHPAFRGKSEIRDPKPETDSNER